GQGHARVDDGRVRIQEVRGEGQLHAFFRIGDDRHQGDFGTGAGGGRNHEEGLQGTLQVAGARELVQVVAAFGDQDIHALAGVDHRTAADGDDGVAAFVPIKLGGAAHHVQGGVGRYIVIHRTHV